MNNYIINCAKVFGILLVLSSLNACRSESSSADSRLQSGTKSGSFTENAGAHQHQKHVKPGAAVGLKDSTPLFAPAPGSYEYQLSLISPLHTGNMTVVALAGEGITILSPVTRFEFVLENNGEYVFPLTINAAQEGRYYIQLHMSIVVDGQPASRVIAVILQVADSPVTKQKVSIKRSDANSDGVIVLPAQETISPQ